MAALATLWIPAFAGMTGVKDGNGGRWFSGRLLALADNTGVGGALGSRFRGNDDSEINGDANYAVRVPEIRLWASGLWISIRSADSPCAAHLRALRHGRQHEPHSEPLAKAVHFDLYSSANSSIGTQAISSHPIKQAIDVPSYLIQICVIRDV